MKSFGRLLALLVVCMLMASVMSSEYTSSGILHDLVHSLAHPSFCSPGPSSIQSTGKLLKDESILETLSQHTFHGDLSESLDAFLGNLTHEFQSFVGTYWSFLEGSRFSKRMW